MSKPLRITLIALTVLLVLLLLGLLGVWYAIKQQPAWYVDEVQKEANSPENREAGKEMEQGIAHVISGFEKSGRWEAVFTEEQINGYLAATLAEKHPDLLPPELKDPRVKIESDGLTVAARLEDPVETVVSLKIDLFLVHPNTIAIRVRQIRVGSLPWSLERLTEEISTIAQKNRISLHWTQSEQDPVAMITIVPKNGKKVTEITACQLEEGKLYLSGTTKPAKNRK